jgi:hypothetical protein
LVRRIDDVGIKLKETKESVSNFFTLH